MTTIDDLLKDIKRIEQTAIAFVKTCESIEQRIKAHQKFQGAHVEMLKGYHPNLQWYIPFRFTIGQFTDISWNRNYVLDEWAVLRFFEHNNLNNKLDRVPMREAEALLIKDNQGTEQKLIRYTTIYPSALHVLRHVVERTFTCLGGYDKKVSCPVRITRIGEDIRTRYNIKKEAK